MRPRPRAARAASPLTSTAVPMATAPIKKNTTSEAKPPTASGSRAPGLKASKIVTTIAVTPIGVASEIHSMAPAAVAPSTACPCGAKFSSGGESSASAKATSAATTQHSRHPTRNPLPAAVTAAPSPIEKKSHCWSQLAVISIDRQPIFRHRSVRKAHAKEGAMRRRLPPLKTLPAFEIAAERLSFTDAAGELHVTHGAVSRQIQALEAHLGVPLFRRRNRRIELTEAGVAFLPGVRQALHVLETST